MGADAAGAIVIIRRQGHEAEGRYKSRLAKHEWLLSAVAPLDREDQKALFAAASALKRLAES